MSDSGLVLLAIMAAVSAAGILACALDSIHRVSEKAEVKEDTGPEKPGRDWTCARDCMQFQECALLVAYESVAKACAAGRTSARIRCGWVTPAVKAELERNGFEVTLEGGACDVSWGVRRVSLRRARERNEKERV